MAENFQFQARAPKMRLAYSLVQCGAISNLVWEGRRLISFGASSGFSLKPGMHAAEI